MVEVLVAVTILTIGSSALSATLFASMSLNRTNREITLAMDGAQSALEALRGESFDQVFVRYNSNPADDPGAAGTAPGNTFAITGLDVQRDDPDGFVGEIVFPGNGPALLENVADEGLGTPRDLDGDGLVDAADHSTSYIVLPVRVRVAWRGDAGNRELEFVTTLTRY